MMPPDKLRTITELIGKEFVVNTPLRRALALTVERLIQEDPAASWVQTEGDDVVVYVLAGSVVHEVRGTRTSNDNDMAEGGGKARPPKLAASCAYRLMRITADATVQCEIEQTENTDAQEAREINEHWRFELGAGQQIKISCSPPPPAGHHRFALAVERAGAAGP